MVSYPSQQPTIFPFNGKVLVELDLYSLNHTSFFVYLMRHPTCDRFFTTDL